jgi:hypothetical protein
MALEHALDNSTVATLIQGACVALVVPGTLGLLRLFIPNDQERLRAMTWWSGISLAGSGAGPIAGGLSVDANAWRAIFVLPILLSIVAWWCLRQREGDAPAQAHCERRIDRHGLFADRVVEGSGIPREQPRLCQPVLRGLRAVVRAGDEPAEVALVVFGANRFLHDDASGHDVALASPIARVSTGERGWWFAAIGASLCAMGLFALAAIAEQATPATLITITALVGAGFAFALGGVIDVSAAVALAGAAVAGLMAVSPRVAAPPAART